MNLTILNNNYEIKEISQDTPEELSLFSKHLKSMKEFICKRKSSLTKENFNINPSFIIKELTDLKKLDNRFCLAIYQTVISYDKQHKRPTAILFARKGSRNNTYIISLLCRYEGSTKGLGKILMDNLIKKAKSNNIEYIYVESMYNSKIFYKNNEFDSDSEKEKHTESDKKPECSGYILKMNNETMDQHGGSNINNIYIYKLLYDISYENKLEIYNNNNLIGKLTFNIKIHPIYGYISFEIENFDISIGNLLLSVLDSIAQNYYIYKSYMFLRPEENELKIFLFNELYEQKKNKMMLNYFEKQHNKCEYIDRTILSYYHLD